MMKMKRILIMEKERAEVTHSMKEETKRMCHRYNQTVVHREGKVKGQMEKDHSDSTPTINLRMQAVKNLV